MAAYIPDKGDFITISFDPQSGHEQKGRRPALVISNFLFNRATGLAITSSCLCIGIDHVLLHDNR
jgi:mRNA interferase MazF